MSTNDRLSEEDESKEEEEEDYVLLDLDAVSGQVHIPPNAPYVLSGLDTLNPILIIDNNIKLIGKYEETIGTCLVFSENDSAPVVNEEARSSDANISSGKSTVDSNQTPAKQIKPIARLQKILKFRLMSEAETDALDATALQSNT